MMNAETQKRFVDVVLKEGKFTLRYGVMIFRFGGLVIVGFTGITHQHYYLRLNHKYLLKAHNKGADWTRCWIDVVGHNHHLWKRLRQAFLTRQKEYEMIERRLPCQ